MQLAAHKWQESPSLEQQIPIDRYVNCGPAAILAPAWFESVAMTMKGSHVSIER